MASLSPPCTSNISIHASARRATIPQQLMDALEQISIHALREEGDGFPASVLDVHLHFYPRPPRGGRPSAEVGVMVTDLFLSTPSARRATLAQTFIGLGRINISIHALREEGDQRTRIFMLSVANFYPRPPRGGRLTEAISS